MRQMKQHNSEESKIVTSSIVSRTKNSLFNRIFEDTKFQEKGEEFLEGDTKKVR